MSACMCCAYTHKLFIMSNVEGNGPNLNEHTHTHTQIDDTIQLSYDIHSTVCMVQVFGLAYQKSNNLTYCRQYNNVYTVQFVRIYYKMS